jgi:hypothetical protein
MSFLFCLEKHSQAQTNTLMLCASVKVLNDGGGGEDGYQSKFGGR